MPFAYAATVGGDGAVWIGGAWWTAGPGTREAFVARWDGERLGEVGTTPESGRARIVDATPTAAGARFSGVGTDATGVARTAVWDAGPAGVTVRLGEEIGPMPKPPPPPAPFDRTPPPGFVEVPHRWAADGAGALWLATTVSAADGGGPPGLRRYRWRPDTDGGPRDTRRATKSCRSREPSVSFEATDG